MSDFFLSYSNNDSDFADSMVKAIKSIGYSVWNDKEQLNPGQDFTKNIQENLKNVKCLIVLVSKNSVDSEWVSCEITEAKNNKIPVIPITLDDTKPASLHIQLNNIHYVDMREWKKNLPLPPDLLNALKEYHAIVEDNRPSKEIKPKPDNPGNPARRKFIELAAMGAGGVATGSIYNNYSTMPIVKWKMNNVVSEVNGFPKESFLVKVGDLLCRKISDLTEGRFTIEQILVNEELKHKPLTMLQDESFHHDCTFSSIYFQDTEDESVTYKPLYFRYAIPFGLSPEGQMSWLFEREEDGSDRKRKVLFDETLDKKFISIPLATTGFQSGIWSNKELNTIADLKDLKIRLSGIGAEVFKGFHADIQKDFKIVELPRLLKEGKLDAAEWLGFEDDITILKMNEVAKYFYYPAWWEPSTSFDLHINKASWEELGNQSLLYQKLLEYSCSELYISSWSHYVMTNSEMLDTKEKWGKNLTFQPFSDEFTKDARKMTDKILGEFSNNPKFKIIYEEWQETKRKLEKWAEFTNGFKA